MRRILKEIALAAWLPTTAGTLTFATSWLVWFLTEPACVPSPDILCPKLPWGRYITHEVLGDCYIRTFVAISVTGGSDVMLFIRELRNREKDKKIADERLEQEKQQRAEDRQRYDEQQKINAQQRAEDLERYDRQRAEDRERYDRMMEKSEAMLQQVIEERRAAEARFAEERRQHETRMAEELRAAEARIEARLAAEERIRRLEAQLAQQQTANGRQG